MTKLDPQFLEDKALRDAARAVLVADIDHARETFSAKGVATRVGERVGDGAKDVLEVAKTQADDNRGILAALIGAILLWIGRDTIFEILGFAEPDTEPAEQATQTPAPSIDEPDVDSNGSVTAGGEDEH